MIIRVLFLIFGAIGMLNAQARAQVFLEQAKVNLEVSGADHRDGTLLIHNTSSDPVDIRVYWEDFDYKPPYDGNKNFLPAGTAPGSASQWVTFSPQNFTIPPMGQQNVDYSVTVPADINEGHYGVLFFEKSVPASINSKEINLITRIGCLFFIEPKNKIKQAVLQDISLNGNNITAGFVNKGNVILIAHPTFYIMQGEGLVLFRGDAKRLYVPPGAIAPLNIPLKTRLKQGHYTLVINCDLEEGDVVVKEIGLDADASGQLTIVNS